MVESYRPSAKHQGGSFHEAESNQTFFERCYVYVPDFANKLLFVSF